MSLFKELVYDEVVRVLNLSKIITFKGGYLIGLYQNGIPYVVDSSSSNKFDYERMEVVPVSEEISNETPSVNLADRSDYYMQYQIFFRVTNGTAVKTALKEFRDYFFANKQMTIDGYTVAIKTSRGDKQATVPVQSGNFYSFYKISVYLTAIKNGYIKKDTDVWKMRLHDVGDYQTMKLVDDVLATSGTIAFTNKHGVSKGKISNTVLNSKLVVFYNGTDIDKKLYSTVMNKEDRDTLWDIVHIFDGVTFEYVAVISGGARTLKDNDIAILEINWIEADV